MATVSYCTHLGLVGRGLDRGEEFTVRTDLRAITPNINFSHLHDTAHATGTPG